MPVALDVRNKKIVLIGGGRVAWHKIESLQQYTNHIYVIAKEVDQRIKDAGYTFIEKEFEPKDIEDAFIVYACTNIRLLNSAIKKEATARRILVNVVDNPVQCDFVSPAIIKQDNISIAVSSNGQDVMKSIAIRNNIKKFLENDPTFTI